MRFDIKGKVALISGGASGIGLSYAKELLRKGLKGVTLADVNSDFGKQAVHESELEFGPNKAIFVQTDVTSKHSYEAAFKETIKTFKKMDILINNAGILNDTIWEKQNEVNINGTIHGILLGLEHYIPKYKTESEGVIVNISSTAGVTPFKMVPLYTGTKFAVMGMSKAFGDEAHYNRTKIRVLTLCPGATDTPLFLQMSGRNLGPSYEKLWQIRLQHLLSQPAERVANDLVRIIENAKTGTVWVSEAGQDLYEFILPERESFYLK